MSTFTFRCGKYFEPPLSPRQRAALSHLLRLKQQGDNTPYIDSSGIAAFFAQDQLPSIAAQVANVVRFIGERVTDTGDPVGQLPDGFFASVGSVSPSRADELIAALVSKGLLSANDRGISPPGIRFIDIDLTLDGWDRYESERKGRETFGGGFLALKFGTDVLERFVAETIKPAAQSAGYQLVDMRDVPRAGVIDNLMRMQIRDSAFVVADLSHENNGAYWEAGFAEGLGKPVIYLCEKSKFEETATHFDTNHCTTILWDINDPDGFSKEFVATIRNTMQIFGTNADGNSEVR